MANKLTKKQKGFVDEYIKTGIGVEAALKNYETTDNNTARSIASENLTKPNIVKAIADAIPDELLTQRHLELLNKREVEIKYNSVTKQFDKVELGPETKAVSKALDMAYKIKSTYAPEKSLTMNINVEELRDLIKENLATFRANK